MSEIQLFSDPPRNRSVAAALYFYKKSIANASYMFGQFPDWVTKLTVVSHQAANAAEKFLNCQKWFNGHMIMKIYDEPEIAYKYALLAESDANAAAFLNSNNQVRFVRDCSQMVKII